MCVCFFNEKECNFILGAQLLQVMRNACGWVDHIGNHEVLRFFVNNNYSLNFWYWYKYFANESK